MKKQILMSTLLLFGNVIYAGESADNNKSVSFADGLSLNAQLEERVFSDKTSLSLIKFMADYTITEKISFFGGVWFRDKVPVFARDSHPPHLEGKSEYIEYVDIFGGLFYDLYEYVSPYFFLEAYYDKEVLTDKWGTFSALGLGGTLYDEGKHNVSYYTEWYFTLNTYDLESWRYWSSETAIKYKYSIYDKTALYIQAVWNTDTDEEGYGVPGYSDGIYSTRIGIQVDF